MSPWLPLPRDVESSPAIAALSHASRSAWFDLRVAHARYGLGVVVPAAHSTAVFDIPGVRWLGEDPS